MDLAVFVLALYFIQEGRAQSGSSESGIIFFVDFPTKLLPLAYAAAVLMIPNLAVTIFTLLRGLYIRRWPWVTTAVAVFCLALITADLGFDGVRTIIAP